MTADREGVRLPEAIRLSLGGYVLGTLSPEEDEQVSAHLAECAECRAEYARLAGLPALLATITEAEAAGEAAPAPSEDLAERLVRRAAHSSPSHVRPDVRSFPATVPEVPQEGLLDGLLRQAATRRRTTTRRRQLAGVAAALLLAAVAAGGTWLATSGSAGNPGTRTAVTLPAPVRTFAASDPTTGVSASVGVAPAAWGSVLQISTKGVPAGTTCTLQVVSGEGTRAVGATWLAGDTRTIPGSVPIPPTAIAHFDIVAGNGQTLLTIPA